LLIYFYRRRHYANELEGIDFSNPEHIFDFSAGPTHKKTITLSLNGKQYRKMRAKPSILLSELEILPPDEDGEVRVREKKFRCKLCGDKFYRSTHLTRHMRVHTGERPYYCYICRRRFARCDYREAHVYIHRRNKLHSCPICGEVYHDLTSYADHCQSHPDSEYIELCKQEEVLKAQKKIAANKLKSSTKEQPVNTKESASSISLMNTEPIDKEDDVSIIQNPLYSQIKNCKLQPETSAHNVSVSIPLLTTNGYCSLDNGHLTSPVYILAHPSEDAPQIAFMSVNHQSQPPPLLVPINQTV